MSFPQQERFTPESLANYWNRKVDEIDELLRTVQFTHIIVEGPVIDRVSPSRHLYFDLDAWRKFGGEDLARACDTYRDELEKSIKSITGDKTRKIKGHENVWWKKRLEFNSAHLRKQYERYCGPMHLEIGPTKIAQLILFPCPEKEWVRPNADVRVYIPRSAVEAFEKKRDIHLTGIAEPEPASDISAISPEKWYGTRAVARFIGRDLKYVQNELMGSGQLKGVRKRGNRLEVQGLAIIEYLQKYRS